jgi:hypothetical protein
MAMTPNFPNMAVTMPMAATMMETYEWCTNIDPNMGTAVTRLCWRCGSPQANGKCCSGCDSD